MNTQNSPITHLLDLLLLIRKATRPAVESLGQANYTIRGVVQRLTLEGKVYEIEIREVRDEK